MSRSCLTTIDDDLPVRLNHVRIDDAAYCGIETEIKRTIGIEPGKVRAALTAYLCEAAASKDFAVCLRQDVKNAATEPGVEVCIQGAIWIQAGDALSELRAKRDKSSTHQYLAIGQHGQSSYQPGIWSRIESRVQSSIGIEPANVLATLSAQTGETAANENLSVGLKRETLHFGRKNSKHDRMEVGLDGPIRKKPRDVGPALAADLSKTAADEDFAVRLDDERKPKCPPNYRSDWD